MAYADYTYYYGTYMGTVSEEDFTDRKSVV